MLKTTVNIKYADGLSLAVLSRYIEHRQRILGESVTDAVVATAIDALVSIRAATRSALKKTRFKMKVEDTGWYGGFSGKDHMRVIRAGHKANSPRVSVPSARVRWITQMEKDPLKRKVFKVTPEHQSIAPYYIVAQNKSKAKEFEANAARHRVTMMGGLGKNALGVAMAKLSTRNVKSDGSSVCRNRASTLAVVRRTDSSVYVEDELNYSVEALRGGKSAISLALKKAANKISGRLRKTVIRKGLQETILTPFPEVKQRKVK